VLRGIGRFIRAHGPWSIFIQERGVDEPAPEWLARFEGDGIIARVSDARMMRAGIATSIPIVNLRYPVPGVDMPTIYGDDAAIATLALQHFRERGFGRFAYCGRPGVSWSDIRYQAFCRAVTTAVGVSCELYSPRNGRAVASWEREQADLARWLKGLPRPLAVLACNDVRGLQVLDACRRIGSPVPGQVAVLGVDNDAVFCDLSDPPLSSIDQDLERIGYDAAALLERLMRGEPPPNGPVLVPPRGVVTRRSTDAIAIDDPAIAAALRYIRLHACRDITIDEVASEAAVSRRVLQRRVKEILGETPHDIILNVRLERLKHLLAETDHKLEDVAGRAGFRYVGHMSAFFKKRTGMTPGEYRRAQHHVVDRKRYGSSRGG
jgi:LacI family transcriptional regulator